MIEFKNIKKSFDDKVVLNDVSHVMQTGMCNLIIGTSGSGKTVLQKCLVGLFEPDSGEIIYDDRSFTDMSNEDRKELRQQIGMLFQGSALFDSMTVEQNVMFPLDMFSELSHKEKLKRVNEVLARVNLVDANNKFPAEISGGMKKRVGIARAIVLNPKYLFCDEPNSGLDPQTSMVIDKLILYMYQGQKEWNGNNEEIIFSKNERLNEFIFASKFLQDAKDMRMLEAKGIISDDRNMEEMMNNGEEIV
jgi:phospholipid/cholesterol/gamma-HCH transport system ATP-binding protein